jgi:hypothetical protein
VQTALTKVGDMKDQWPADENEAFRAVTHRVLLAIFDKSADASAAGGAAAGQSVGYRLMRVRARR